MSLSPQRRGQHQGQRDMWAGRSAELFLQMLANPPEDGTEIQRPQFQESASEPVLQSTLHPTSLGPLQPPLDMPSTRRSPPQTLLKDHEREIARRSLRVTRDRFERSGASKQSKSTTFFSGMPSHPSIIRSLRDSLEPPHPWTPSLKTARGVYETAPVKVTKSDGSDRLAVRRLSMHKYRDATLDPEAFKVLQNKIKSAAYTGAKGQELPVLFSRFDTDGSGELEFDEVERALRHTLKIPKYLVSDDEIQKVCDVLDADGSGAVSVDELLNFVTSGAEDLLAQSMKNTPSLPSQVKPLSKDILSNGELQRLARAKDEGMRLRKKWQTMNHFGLGSTGTPYTFGQVFCEIEGRTTHRTMPDPRADTGRLTSSQLGKTWSASGRPWRRLPFESTVLPTTKTWQEHPRSRMTL
mmetsp:Transcript_23453/g.54673  ORF Transcript_23453/g.54673 Transcript_23453/m.54673 type:complete len:410 (-) Transcript_23453:94-1323(-)